MKEKLSKNKLFAVWRPSTRHTLVEFLSRHLIDNPIRRMEIAKKIEQICHEKQLLAANDLDTGETICDDIKLQRFRSEVQLNSDNTTLVKMTHGAIQRPMKIYQTQSHLTGTYGMTFLSRRI